MAAALLALSGGFAAVAVSFAPSRSIQAAARLETVPPGVRLRGDDTTSITREVRYEWAETLREAEVSSVIVRLRDPACSASSAAPAAAPAASPGRLEATSANLTVTLTAVGFDVPGNQRDLRLTGCEQFIGWDVIPRRANEHQLAFRFHTLEGGIPLSPSRFRVSVAGPLLVPSSLLYWLAVGFSGISGALGLAGFFTGARQWASRLLLRFRRGAPLPPAA